MECAVLLFAFDAEVQVLYLRLDERDADERCTDEFCMLDVNFDGETENELEAEEYTEGGPTEEDLEPPLMDGNVSMGYLRRN